MGWAMRLRTRALSDNSRPIQLLPTGRLQEYRPGNLMADLPRERKLIFSEEKNVDLIYFTGCESPLERRRSI